MSIYLMLFNVHCIIYQSYESDTKMNSNKLGILSYRYGFLSYIYYIFL